MFFKKNPIFIFINLIGILLFQHPLIATSDGQNKSASLQKARYLYGQGEIKKAKIEFENLIQRYPGDMDSWIGLCWSLHQLGQEEEAEQTFKGLLNLTLLDHKVLDQYLFFAQVTGREEETMVYLEERLKTIESDPWISQKLFHLYLKFNRLTDAKAILDTWQEEFSDKDQLSMRMALSYHLTKAKNFTASNVLLNEIRNKYPHYANAIDLEALNFVYLKQYEKTLENLSLLEKYNSSHLDLKKRKAAILFEMKQYKEAARIFETILRGAEREPIVILLYHGIVEIPDGHNVTINEFENQIKTLVQDGYRFIDLDELLSFEQDAPVNSPMALITFDDARRDSYRNADPILRKYNAKAVMFTPFYETLVQPDPFFLSEEELKIMSQSTHWDIQAHGYAAGKELVSGQKDDSFYFLVGKKWLAQENQLETDEDYYKRIRQDHLQWKDLFEKHFPRHKIKAFAFPYGDFGQDSPSNTSQAIEYNLDIVKEFYSACFYQDDKGINYIGEDPYLYRRYRVLPDTQGIDLLSKIKQNKIDPQKIAEELLSSWMMTKEYQKGIKFAKGVLKKQVMPKTFLDDALTAYLKGQARGDLLKLIHDLLDIPSVSSNALYMQARLKQWEGKVLEPAEYAQLGKSEDIFSMQGKESLKQNTWREKFVFFKDTDEIENYSLLSHLELSLKKGISYLLGHEFVHYADRDSTQESHSQNSYKTGLHLSERDQFDLGFNYIYHDNQDLSNTHGFLTHFSLEIAQDTRLAHDFQYDTVPTLKALFNETKVHKQSLQWETGDREQIWYRFLGAYKKYSDDNTRADLGFMLQRRLTEKLPLYGSFRYDYADTQKESDDYYSPQNLSQARLGFSLERKGDDLSAVLKYNFGYGIDKSKEGFIQSSGIELNYHLANNWSVSLSPQYLQTTTYSSVETTCGIKYDF